MYRIYINETALVISDIVPNGLGQFQTIDSQTFDFRDFYKQAKKNGRSVHLLLVDNPKKYFKKLRKSFQLIKAAGGIVISETDQYLFIFRKGKWDLPKGKLDLNEKTRDAAGREVEEECGVKVTRINNKLCTTWHVYEEKTQIIFKKTSWFFMQAKKQKLIPQLEEDITEARWMSKDDFEFVRKNTYPLIRDMLDLILK